MTRPALLSRVADEILAHPSDGIRRVGVDGVDGAGKTVFADELAAVLAARARPVIRAGVDDFHHPRAIRYRLGRTSPEGCYRDTFDYPVLRSVLLDPLSPNGSRRYRRAVFDWRTDTPVHSPVETAPPDAVLVFDGIFLHRPELVSYWDYSVFLDVPFDISYARMAHRDGSDPSPDAPGNTRFRDAQRHYLAVVDPAARASVVIANHPLADPVVTTSGGR